MLERLVQFGSVPLLVVALLVAGIGVPVPEDAVLLAGGAVAHRSGMAWEVLLPLLYSSALAADLLVYLLARRYGERFLSRRWASWLVTPTRRARVQRLFARHGARAVFVGRHLSGVRTVVFALAAIEGVPFWTFVFWDALAGLVTIPVVFGLGYLGSSHLAAVAAGLARAEHWVAFGAGVLAFVAWGVWSRGRRRRV